MNKQFKEVSIASIEVKTKTRSDNGDLSTLENSIRKLGLLHPIIIGNDNILICGERRLQACLNLGLSVIPAIILDVDYDSMTAVEIQSDANLCRQQLSSVELEKLIQTKKSFMSSKQGGSSTKLGGSIKKLFTRS